MQEEIELKLSLPHEQAQRLRRHPLIRNLKVGRAQTKRLVGTYYDTPELALKQRDLSLRVREVDKQKIQTLKRLGPSSGGLHIRDEWESEVNGVKPDPTCIENRAMRKLISASEVATSLRPVFKTDVKRTAWNLRDGDAEIELALDIGEIWAEDGQREEICEAELELKSGDPRRLFDIALALNDRVDFTMGHRSKSDRGYALYCGERLRPTKAKRVKLKREMSVWQAFVSINQSCLAHLQDNEFAVHAEVDPEGVHQARVAIRRLRAAFKLFKPVLPTAEARFYAAELRWLQRQLGDARDWDVFIGETVDPLRVRFADDDALRHIAQRSEQARQRSYVQARNALESGRYGRLRLTLQRWLMTGADTARSGPMAGRIGGFAKQSIKRAYRRVSRLGRHLSTMDDAGLHELRIRVKRARYCVEFFRSLYSQAQARSHGRKLTALQDCLGTINDGAVAHDLLLQLKNGSTTRHAVAEAYVAGWFSAQAATARRELSRDWSAFTALKPYWT